MSKCTDQFVKFCRETLDFSKGITYEYGSLSACIIDCVYSLRTKYATTEKIVKRYVDKYLNGDKKSKNEKISDMLMHFTPDNIDVFRDCINNNQVLGKSKVAKDKVCYKLARYLKCLHIETIEDFMNFSEQELLEIVLRAVDGMGDAGVNYLFMLAGDDNRCKPDVHVNRFIMDACGASLSNAECQELFAEAVEILKEDNPNMTVKMLDGLIWQNYSSKA